MRLLKRNIAGEFILTKDFVDDDDVPPYAILSHTWVEGEEVTFEDLTNNTGKHKLGYEKIRFCGERARHDGLQYFWVDTCCINKANFTELSQAINSMFRWYKNATKCYVYLSDVSTIKRKASDEDAEFTWKSTFRESRWFKRGWTLQELLAPSSVEFFSREGKRLGDKKSLEQQIFEITGISNKALRQTPLSQFSVDERMSWAKYRQTTRKEDKIYSLLGIFDVYMPLIYGEGEEKAYKRLRREIGKPSNSPAIKHGSLTSRSGLENDLVDYLLYASEAPFNSYTKQHEPTCLPDTRVDLLQTIHSWADRQDECCIFWLNGLAGTGKSTIARTVARRYFDERRLGASFFFSRGGGDVGHAGKFCTTLAVQLAEHVPTLRRHICDAITEHGNIVSLSLQDQWRQLVLKPLSKLSDDFCPLSYIIVIDALDECDNDSNIRLILHLLAEARSLKTVRLRIFLTSRPEVPIRFGFYQLPENERYDTVLHNIFPLIIDHDISIFFEYNLTLIGEEHAQDASWPGADVIKALVESANGLFIWAATACRFIRDGPFADERLHRLLQGGASDTAHPEEHLNRIYLTVLQKSIQPDFSQQDKERFCSMLRDTLGSIVALFSPLSVGSLSRLLAAPKQRVDRLLKDLHTILDIPKDPIHPLRLHHPSFRDFLLDQNRCTDASFWVNQKQAHQTLAESCIQLMSAYLKQDVCGLDAPGVLITEVESSRVEQYLPPEVQYACLYWVQHLQRSCVRLRDNDQVHQFLQIHFLHLLEALSWTRRISEGILAIRSLEFIALVSLLPACQEHTSNPSSRHAIVPNYTPSFTI
jgi:Heterokaryon incompatibility protein (HET)/NACHT domain